MQILRAKKGFKILKAIIVNFPIYLFLYLQKDCPEGHFCPQESMFIPERCPIGTYSQWPGATICERCPEGKNCSEIALQQPKICDRGYECSGGIPKICPENFYNNKGNAISMNFMCILYSL